MSGRRSVAGGGGVHARFARGLYRHAFAVEQPAAENVGGTRLAVLFLCSPGACYARSPRDIFGGNARLSVFFALQTYKFSSSAFLGIPLYSPISPLRNHNIKKLRRKFRPPGAKKPARALSSHLQTTLHQENFGVSSAKMAKILEKSRAARAQGW